MRSREHGRRTSWPVVIGMSDADSNLIDVTEPQSVRPSDRIPQRLNICSLTSWARLHDTSPPCSWTTWPLACGLFLAAEVTLGPI